MEGLAVFSPAFNGQPVFRDAVKTFVKADAEAEGTDGVDDIDMVEAAAALAVAAAADRDTKIKALEAKVAELSKPPEGAEGSEGDDSGADDGDGADDGLEPVTKADLAALTSKVDRIAEAAGVKESEETTIEKGGDGVKDDYKSWDL